MIVTQQPVLNPPEPRPQPAQVPAPADEGTDVTSVVPRRTRTVTMKKGDLGRAVKMVIDGTITGKISFDGPITPSRIGRRIAEDRDDGYVPSNGAITNILRDWAEGGICTVSAKPLAFESYTNEARTYGLSTVRDAHAAGITPEEQAARNDAAAALAGDA